jgi:hypothetical protein
VKSGSFQRDFRNADGTSRREKVLLDLEKLDEEIIYFLDGIAPCNLEKNQFFLSL